MYTTEGAQFPGLKALSYLLLVIETETQEEIYEFDRRIEQSAN